MIGRLTQDIVLAEGYNTGYSPVAAVGDQPLKVNGILRAITIVAPDIDGSSYQVFVLGARGETLFSQGSLTELATSVITQDGNNVPLQIPLAHAGTPVIKIRSTDAGDDTGTLTFANSANIIDGETVTIGDQVYRFKNTLAQANDVLIEADTDASGTITLSNNPADGGTFVLGSVTYTFKDTLTGAANEIKIGADAATTLDNIKSAVNASAGAGTAYGTGTVANPDASATTNTDTTQLFVATASGAAGNSVVFTESATNTTVDGSGTLFGGDWNGDATLANLADAINLEDGGGESGTKYHEDTVENPYVTAGSVTSHALGVTAKEVVEAGEDVATTETSSVLSWGLAHLSGGGESAEQTFTVDMYIEQ